LLFQRFANEILKNGILKLNPTRPKWRRNSPLPLLGVKAGRGLDYWARILGANRAAREEDWKKRDCDDFFA